MRGKNKTIEVVFQRGRSLSKYTETLMFTYGEVKEMLKEAKIELTDDDVLEIGYEPGFYEEDNSADSQYFVKVSRTRDKTEEELKKDKDRLEAFKTESKKRRYESYLKLKEEFEAPAPPKTTTIPKEQWGVHKQHCCLYHGCKYGDKDCPVFLSLTEQVCVCDICEDVSEHASE